MFSTVALKNVLEFYCIFNNISLYISLLFYRMAINVFVAFQAAFSTHQLIRLGATAPFPGR
jgi:hypothetical protein